jgi:hypothetical protein
MMFGHRKGGLMKSAFSWAAVLTIGLLAATAAAGEMQVTPYGFVLLNAGYNNHQATDIPVKAALADTGDAVSTMLLTARQTRFGLKLGMDTDEGWGIKGAVELDFWGQKGSGANGASMQSAPRLRLAFFSLKKENLQLLFGQDWTCFAPLSPNSMAHVSIPAFSSSGNLWNRLPQIRMDYTVPMESDNSLLIQVAAVRPIAADAVDAGQGELLGAGEFSGIPFGQARVAFAHAKKFTGGVSVHFGQENWDKKYPADGYADDEKTTTFGAAGDLKITTAVVGFAAEGFVGSNLPMMFSNAGNFAKMEDSKKTREGYDVMGGWGEVSVKPADSKVSFNGGAGIEILDEDQVKDNATAGGTLWKNMTVFGAVFYDPMPKVTFALELGYITTTYKYLAGSDVKEGDGTNLNANCGFRLSF